MRYYLVHLDKSGWDGESAGCDYPGPPIIWRSHILRRDHRYFKYCTAVHTNSNERRFDALMEFREEEDRTLFLILFGNVSYWKAINHIPESAW